MSEDIYDPFFLNDPSVGYGGDTHPALQPDAGTIVDRQPVTQSDSVSLPTQQPNAQTVATNTPELNGQYYDNGALASDPFASQGTNPWDDKGISVAPDDPSIWQSIKNSTLGKLVGLGDSVEGSKVTGANATNARQETVIDKMILASAQGVLGMIAQQSRTKTSKAAQEWQRSNQIEDRNHRESLFSNGSGKIKPIGLLGSAK